MRARHKTESLLGKWNPIAGLLASDSEPIAARKVIIEKLNAAAHDLGKSEFPDLESWRNLTDGMNLMQSLKELGFIEDHDGVIYDVKAALLEAFDHHVKHGKLRMRATSLDNSRTLVVNAGDLLDAISARIYWSAVRRTEKRIQRIWDGHKKSGDVVVSL